MGTFGTPSSYNNAGALGGATNPTTAQGLSRDRENQKAILELPGTQAWVEKTITDGVIIPTSAEIIVLPEGGASADSLTTIALTSDGTTALHEGMPIRLKAANSNTITVVHGTGANNISTIDGNNVVLDTTWYLELKLINGLWVQQETSAYKTASTPATTTSRGIGRVATSADLVDGATINNGPAFLAAGDASVRAWLNSLGDVADILASLATSKTGYLLCNGGAYSRTTYAALFAILGTSFGAGDGSTTFNVPDFRGRTLQGANANLKAVLAAGLPNAIGQFTTVQYVSPYDLSGAFSRVAISGSVVSVGGSLSQGQLGTKLDLSGYNSIYGASTTVQPPAIAVNIFIKY